MKVIEVDDFIIGDPIVQMKYLRPAFSGEIPCRQNWSAYPVYIGLRSKIGDITGIPVIESRKFQEKCYQARSSLVETEENMR